MKKILSVKLFVLALFCLLTSLPAPLFAQDEDPFELDAEDWSDEALDEAIDKKAAPPSKSGSKSSSTATIEEEEDLPDLDDFDEEPAPTPKVDKKAAKKAEEEKKSQEKAVKAEVQVKEQQKQVAPPPPPPPSPVVTPPVQAAPAPVVAPVVSKPKAVLEPITPTQSSYNVNSVVKRAGPPLVLVTRPIYAPYSTEDKTMYISAVAEAYFNFKLGALPGIQVVPAERIVNNVQYFRDFTRRISRTSYIEASKKIGAAYCFYSEYEPKGKKVKFAVEVYSIADNKKIAGSIEEIEISDLENGLFDFVNDAASAMVGTLPGTTQEFMATSVLGSGRQIEALGQAIVSVGDFTQKRAEKAAPEFEKSAKDNEAYAAKYVAAQMLARANKLDKAIAIQKDLVDRFGAQYPALSLQLASYYRMAGSYDNALSAVRDAENDPALKLPALIEKAKIHEANDKLNEAKREYESVLSQGGEDGEIYFQLAIVSIGLNDLSQVDRYLEKAASAGRELDQGDYFELGLRYEELGSANEQAIAAFRSCLGLRQDNEEAWKKLATIYSLSGRMAEAAECYVSLFQINNEMYKDTLARAGMMFEDAGYLDNAKEVYALYLARRFYNQEVSIRLAKLEMQGGNCPKAIELVDGMDTLSEFGQDIIMINTQCGKQERRVVIPTSTGRDKSWRKLFFWRVASGVVMVGGGVGGYLLNDQAKKALENYNNAKNVADVNKYRKQVEDFAKFRNLSYLAGGVGLTSFALSITLPIVLSGN